MNLCALGSFYTDQAARRGGGGSVGGEGGGISGVVVVRSEATMVAKHVLARRG